MSIRAIMDENIDGMSEEMIANKVLLYSDISYENIPIKIEEILKKADFQIVRVRFKNEEVVAGIEYRKENLESIQTNRYVALSSELELVESRYLLALAVSYFILESNNGYYSKPILKNAMVDLDMNRAGRIARAIIMPQKSMNTLLMSPFVNKDDIQEKIDKVSKAFLIPYQVAKLRMRELGYIN